MVGKDARVIHDNVVLGLSSLLSLSSATKRAAKAARPPEPLPFSSSQRGPELADTKAAAKHLRDIIPPQAIADVRVPFK